MAKMTFAEWKTKRCQETVEKFKIEFFTGKTALETVKKRFNADKEFQGIVKSILLMDVHAKNNDNNNNNDLLAKMPKDLWFEILSQFPENQATQDVLRLMETFNLSFEDAVVNFGLIKHWRESPSQGSEGAEQLSKEDYAKRFEEYYGTDIVQIYKTSIKYYNGLSPLQAAMYGKCSLRVGKALKK